MRGAILALWLFTASVAMAQEPEPVVHVDDETGERYIEARPSEPLRQGSVVVPPWAIYGAGALVAAASVFLLARRLRSSS